MSSQTVASVLEYIRHLECARGRAEQDDGQFLQQFVAQRDEGAFAALLQRHGPLVFAVCRQVLQDPHDAEDAFQATFLVLARKAASIRRHESLAAWLHRVAVHLAQTARISAAKRRRHERQVVRMAQESPLDEVALRNWQPILHEEIDRLPEKYRVPVVLCYFEGKTHEAAARQLGWPLGTVKGRLARAREMLRTRLTRRGVALPAGGLVAALAENAAAAVPPALLGLTLRAAVSFAAGSAVSGAAASAQVITLAKGAIRTITTTRLVHGIVLLLAIGVALFGAALGIGAGWETLQGGRTQATQQRDSGGTLDPAAHPDQQDRAAKALPPASDPTKVPPADFGPEVEGLRAKVTLAKEKFEVGEATPVKYVVKNVSHDEQVIWHRGFWPNHVLVVKDADGKEPPLTEFGSQCRKAFSPNRTHGGKRVPVKVPPGGEDRAYEEYDLTTHFDVSRPGRYTVQYLYDDRQPEGGWAGRLPSNVVAFEVVAKREKKGEEADPTKAVRVKGLEFVPFAPDRVFRPLPGTTRDFDLGLRVTNVSDKPLALSTRDVIRPRLYRVDGKEGKEEVGIDIRWTGASSVATPPARLAPGASWTWETRATVSWTTDRSSLQLRGPLGYGVAAVWSFTTLKEGKYRLAIEYSNSDPKQVNPRGEVALWVGKATTNEVEFEIVANDAVKEELKKLQGAWRLTGYEEGGKVVPPENFTGSLTLTETTFVFKSGKRVLTGNFTIDPSRKPKWIDESSIDETTGGGLVFKGIYELDGDRLRLFLEPLANRNDRPADFKTRAGTLQRIHTYTRVKPIEERPPRAGGDPTKVKGPEQVLSDAVRVADVDFQVICDAKCWIPPQDKKQFVDLGLRLTNRGEKTLLFNLYDTLKLGLKTADGTPIKYEWMRLRTAIPRPIVLGKGETRTVYIDAQLRWRGEAPVLQLGGTDPTGGFWHFDKLAAGKYLLHVEYENTEKTQADFVKFAKFQPEEGQVFWVNKASTADVAFEVVSPARPEKDLGKVSVEDLARDLSSEDGANRVSASHELLRRGKDILKDLEKAGAKEVLPIVSPTEKQPMTRRLDLVYSLIRGLPQVDPKSRMGIRMNRITLSLDKGVTRAEFDRMERQYKFGLHVERQDLFRPDAATVCDVVITEEWQPAARTPTEKLEQAVEEILTTEPRVETISLIVPVKSPG